MKQPLAIQAVTDLRSLKAVIRSLMPNPPDSIVLETGLYLKIRSEFRSPRSWEPQPQPPFFVYGVAIVSSEEQAMIAWAKKQQAMMLAMQKQMVAEAIQVEMQREDFDKQSNGIAEALKKISEESQAHAFEKLKKYLK